MPGSKLFEPITIGGKTLANRIVIAPMCQYSASNGEMNDWHLTHYGQLAQSGAGILTIEACAVEPIGRISYADIGLYNDATEAAMKRVLEGIRRWSPMPIAIQLAHAGRKASCELPWRGGGQLPPSQATGWQTVSSANLPFRATDNAPTALDAAGLKRVRDAFVQATQRSTRLGIDAIQLHAAHGYLLHQFLSPIANRREDTYGGSLENRMRFPLEIFEAVRAAFPADRPVTVRVSGSDWVDGGWDVASTIAFARALEARGCAAINISGGGLDPRQQVPPGPGYQVPMARAVKQAVGMPVVAVGLINDFDHAEAIIASGDADMVGLARAMLYDPRWPWHAAAHLGAQIKVAPQFLRSNPAQHRKLFAES